MNSTPDEAKQAPVAPKTGRRALVVITLCVLVGAGYLLSQTRNEPAKKGKSGGKTGQSAVVPVAVAKVRRGSVNEFITGLGTVTPLRTVAVTSRVAGELMNIGYTEGQIVKKGDLLAVIDPRPYQAVLVQAQGQLARDQALLKNAYIDLDRYKKAYQVHSIPEQQLATQQATVEQDEGIVKLDQGNMDAAQVNVDYTKISSPVDGRVGLRLVDPGNIVQANGTNSLLVVTQLQPITVIFTVAEDYISEVVSQMRAGRTLRVDALDRDQQKEIAPGTLLTIDNQVDTTTGTVKMKATFPNEDNALFPNEFVNAKLLVRTLSNVDLVPSAAIQHDNDVAFVYVVRPDNTAQSRNVTVTVTDGDTTAVTGVEPGETVVTDGFDKLQDGVKLSIHAGATLGSDSSAPPAASPAAGANARPSAQSKSAHPNGTAE